MKHIISIILVLSVAVGMAQPPAPGDMVEGHILVENGVLHVGNGRIFEKGAISFKDGEITYAGPAINAPGIDYDRVIDAEGGHIYPGFIALNTTLGLQEIGAVRATRDKREVGKITPHVRSIIAYNAESAIIPTARFNGVLLAQVAPRGGVVSGSSSVVQLDAWNWEDAVVSMDQGIHIYWPRLYKWKRKDGRHTPKENGEYSRTIKQLDKLFTEARAYHSADSNSVKNLRLEALEGILDGSQTLFIHADDIKEIRESVQFIDRHDVDKMVLVGGRDAELAMGLLKDHDIAVVLNRVHDLPPFDHSGIDYHYSLPGMLQKNGITVCFDVRGMMAEINVRNIPFYAGTASHYGLEKEKAIQSLTLNAATILGIADRYGSLEEGKSATLFISKGDALDVTGSDLIHAFIDGRTIKLTGRQQRLYDKFQNKVKTD